MAVQRGSTFQGLPAPNAYPRRPINFNDLAARCAQDQGRNFERLTDKDAGDPTVAATVNEGHDHTEEGNLIYHMLMFQQFGAKDGGDFQQPDNAGGILTPNQTSINIIPTPGMTPVLPTIMLYPLVFVPAGHENRDILFLLNCTGDPKANATLQSSTMATVAGYVNVALQEMRISSSMIAEDDESGDFYGFRFQVTTPGIYAVKVETHINEFMGPRKINAVMAMTEFNPVNRTSFPAEPLQSPSASNLVTIGDPDSGTFAWNPIDGNLVGEDGPLGACLKMMAENNHKLFEQATGLPAPGNNTRQATRHKHRGDGESGREIEYPMWTGCFGGLWADAVTEVFGNRSRFPRTQTTGPAPTTRRIVARGRNYFPDSANVTGGAVSPTSRLRAYFLVFCESGKGDTIEVRLQLGATNYDFQSTGFTPASPNFKFGILTVDTGGVTFLTYTANAINDWFIFLRKAVSGTPTATVGILSAALVIDAP